MSDIGEGMSPFPYMLALPQDQTEDILYEELKSYQKDVLWNTELVGFQQAEGVVEVSLRQANGESKTINTAYLVGCDGAGSPVRKQLDLKFEGDTIPKFFYVMDIKIEWDLGYGEDFYMCMAKANFLALIPMPGEQRFRAIGIIPKSAENPENTSVQTLIEIMKEVSNINMTISEVNWHSIYKVHTRKTNTFKVGNCFIAGDAAHVHTPAGGQGMNTGIQDAYNLAWKLKMVIKGEASEFLLNTYDYERELNARNLLEGTDKAFEYQTGDNALISFFRLNVFPPLANMLFKTDLVKKKLFPLFSQINIKYPGSRLTEDSKVGIVEAGDRLPYFKLSDGTSIYEKVKGIKFHLLSTKALNDLELPDFVKPQIIERLPSELFGTQKDIIILIRPDNYISYIGNDTSELKQFLNGDLFVQSKLTYAT